MRIWLSLTLSLCVGACTADRTSPSGAIERAAMGAPTEADEELQALVDALASPPFGTCAALTIRGTAARTKTAGVVYTGGAAVTAETLFNVASVSKVVTASRVIQLAHAGVIGLDDPLRSHLPGVQLVDADGVDRAADVTVRQLLMHQGGLPHQPPANFDPAAFGSSWTDPLLLTRATTSWSIPLARAPGGYGYSNVGYALLGALLEAREKRPFADVMQAHLRELGLVRATYWPTEHDNAAHGAIPGVGGGPATFNDPSWYGSRYALPFNGLWIDSGELAAFGVIVAAAARDAAHPLHALTSPGLARGHGLGPLIEQHEGRRLLSHDGSGAGFLAAWFVLLGARAEDDVTVALMSNGGGEGAAPQGAFSERVRQALQTATSTR